MRPVFEEAPLSVRVFFDEICPKLFEIQADDIKKLGGTLTLRVFGEDGGSWVIDLGEAQIRTGVLHEADAILEMQDRDFLAMMQDRLDLEDALSSGRIRFKGDYQMFAKLGSVLELPEENHGGR